MNEYRKEMGPPPVDIDQASAMPRAERKMAEKRAAEQTKKDYPVKPSAKPPAKPAAMKTYAKGGKIDGCAQRGKTKGRMV